MYGFNIAVIERPETIPTLYPAIADYRDQLLADGQVGQSDFCASSRRRSARGTLRADLTFFACAQTGRFFQADGWGNHGWEGQERLENGEPGYNLWCVILASPAHERSPTDRSYPSCVPATSGPTLVRPSPTPFCAPALTTATSRPPLAEIGDLRFFRGDEYQGLFNHLDRTSKFFTERWGDAPIRSLAVSMFRNFTNTHFFEDIAYLQCVLTPISSCLQRSAHPRASSAPSQRLVGPPSGARKRRRLRLRAATWRGRDRRRRLVLVPAALEGDAERAHDRLDRPLYDIDVWASPERRARQVCPSRECASGLRQGVDPRPWPTPSDTTPLATERTTAYPGARSDASDWRAMCSAGQTYSSHRRAARRQARQIALEPPFPPVDHLAPPPGPPPVRP